MIALLAACADEAVTNDGKDGTLAGQAVVSGPLRGARLSVDQLDLVTGEVIFHVGDATTDDAGRFELRTGVRNGLMRLTATGGEFADLASGETVQLDDTAALITVTELDLLETATDVLVSPIGHLIHTRMQVLRAGAPEVDAIDAYAEANRSLSEHFGGVADWTRLVPARLVDPATSPTEPVRAALVHAALSFLVQDIAGAAGASPQEVNVHTLAARWAEDLADGVFDGNDDNDPASASGLQLGVCPPVPPDCVAPQASCTIGACRALCDVYAGHPRALLAGAMTKVIANPDVNQTGLSTADLLPVARALNDHLSDALFGDACIETLDRLPPSLAFQAPTPAAQAFVRGAVTVEVLAIDDTDPAPRAEIVGQPDADGDPTNSVAQATIDTTSLPDGPHDVVARAEDMSGNVATLARGLVVDNTAPEVTLSATGFFVDGTTWWTGAATPSLTGTVSDAAPVTVKAVVSGVDHAGTVTGTGFTIPLPAGTLDLAGKDVTVVATDAAGNQAAVLQRIRADLTPPGLTFQTSTVRDETGDEIAFFAEIPRHQHTGTVIDLDVTGTCPVVTKHAYLLGASPPPFGTEIDGGGNPQRNPIAYALVASDDGVGIASAATRYRVGRRDGNGNTVFVTGLLSTGAGTPLGGGATAFDVGIFSSVVPGMATTEGVYDVELRTTDRLGRTATVTRCFELRLLAAPLDFVPEGLGMGSGGPAFGHPLALRTTCSDPALPETLCGLSLAAGASFDQIALRLLDGSSSTGASLIDQPFTNGTAETVILAVSVTARPSLMATQRFALRNVRTSVSAVDLLCGPVTSPNASCNAPNLGPVYTSSNVTQNVSTPTVRVRVFELDATNEIAAEVPCLGCAPTDSVFRFAIPPRSTSPGATFRRFVAMTMLDPIDALQPTDTTHPASPPFTDSTVAGVRITGKLGASSTGCTQTQSFGPGGSQLKCIERSTVRPYRALIHAELVFSGPTASSYATAPTEQIAPRTTGITQSRTAPDGWATSEGTLPPNFTF